MAQIDQYFRGNVIAAARALLRQTQAEVAEKANISVSTLKRIEAEGESVAPGKNPSNNYLAVIDVLEKEGVTFITTDSQGHEGVRIGLHWEAPSHQDDES